MMLAPSMLSLWENFYPQYFHDDFENYIQYHFKQFNTFIYAGINCISWWTLNYHQFNPKLVMLAPSMLSLWGDLQLLYFMVELENWFYNYSVHSILLCSKQSYPKTWWNWNTFEIGWEKGHVSTIHVKSMGKHATLIFHGQIEKLSQNSFFPIEHIKMKCTKWVWMIYPDHLQNCSESEKYFCQNFSMFEC